MSDQLDASEAGPRLAMAYGDDGVWDLFLGLSMMLLGLCALNAIPWVLAALGIPLLLLLRVAKRALTLPRYGHPEVWQHGQARTTHPRPFVAWAFVVVVALVSALGLLLFGLAVAPSAPAWLYELLVHSGDLIIAATAGSSLAALALALRTSRFYAYAVLATVVFVGGRHFSVATPISAMLLGSVMVLSGLALLLGFLAAISASAETRPPGRPRRSLP